MCEPVLDIGLPLSVLRKEVKDSVFSKVQTILWAFESSAQSVLDATWNDAVKAYQGYKANLGQRVKHLPGQETKAAFNRLQDLLLQQKYAKTAEAAKAADEARARSEAEAAEARARAEEHDRRMMDRLAKIKPVDAHDSEDGDPFGFPADRVVLSVAAVRAVLAAVGSDTVDQADFLRAVRAIQDVMKTKENKDVRN